MRRILNLPHPSHLRPISLIFKQTIVQLLLVPSVRESELLELDLELGYSPLVYGFHTLRWWWYEWNFCLLDTLSQAFVLPCSSPIEVYRARDKSEGMGCTQREPVVPVRRPIGAGNK